MRFKMILLFTFCLLLTACGDGDNSAESSDAGNGVSTPTAVESAPVEEEDGEIEADAASDVVTDTVAVTDSDGVTTTDLTATATMTATGEITAPMAFAILVSASGDVVGDASFTEIDNAVEVQVSLREFDAAAAGEHGIHIHMVGACTPDFEAAGEHFNPTGASHGLENPDGPHAGDLPNIEIDADGNAIYRVTNPLITLSEDAEGSLIDEDGSALILHAAPDDMTTDPAGESSDRIACGIIELQ